MAKNPWTRKFWNDCRFYFIFLISSMGSCCLWMCLSCFLCCYCLCLVLPSVCHLLVSRSVTAYMFLHIWRLEQGRKHRPSQVYLTHRDGGWILHKMLPQDFYNKELERQMLMALKGVFVRFCSLMINHRVQLLKKQRSSIAAAALLLVQQDSLDLVAGILKVTIPFTELCFDARRRSK